MNVVKFECDDNKKTLAWKNAFRKDYSKYDLKPLHLLSMVRIEDELYMFVGLRTRSKNPFVFISTDISKPSNQFISLSAEDAIRLLNK